VAASMRAALYLRVSTDQQTTENQRLVLAKLAERRGFEIVKEDEDAGISGASGRDKRPAFDAMLKDAVRRRFDLLLVWSIDRLGRSVLHVAQAMAELDAAGVAMISEQQGIDGTGPFGRAMMQMATVFSELERSMIRARIMAGLERVRAEGKKSLGRPKVGPKVEQAIRDQLAGGHWMLKVAKLVGVGSGTVQRVRREMVENLMSSKRKPPVYLHIDGVKATPTFIAVDGVKFRTRLTVTKHGTQNPQRTVCAIMENPSVASEVIADRSVQYLERLIFERKLPCFENVARLIVVNLFAKVQTTNFVGLPADIGAGNDDAIAAAIAESDIIILGWGSDLQHKERQAFIHNQLRHQPGKLLLKTQRHPSRFHNRPDFIAKYTLTDKSTEAQSAVESNAD
jgi:DNA invertase Pin-like site-specific DNA recombinase